VEAADTDSLKVATKRNERCELNSREMKIGAKIYYRLMLLRRKLLISIHRKLL
jgi:hypothetical protein